MQPRSSTSLKSSRSGFFVALAFALGLTLFAGFARSFFLAPAFASEPLTPLLAVHGMAGTAWFALYIWQALLVKRGRVADHRRNGAIAATIIAIIALTSLWIIVSSPFDNHLPNNGKSEATTLLIRGGTLAWFLLLVSHGLRFRTDMARHKRFMTLATIALMAPAFARVGRLLRDTGPVTLPFDSAFLAIGFIGALAMYDRRSLGRIHPVTRWWGGTYIAWAAIRMPLAESRAWQGLAGPVLQGLGGTA